MHGMKAEKQHMGTRNTQWFLGHRGIGDQKVMTTSYPGVSSCSCFIYAYLVLNVPSSWLFGNFKAEGMCNACFEEVLCRCWVFAP